MLRFLRVSLTLVTLVFVAQAQEEGEIRLPHQGYSPAFERAMKEAQAANANSVQWAQFRAQHGEWSAVWNAWGATPYRVWGEGMQVPGFSTITAANADAAARVFLGRVSALLRCDPAKLRLANANEYNGKWSISYDQIHEGVPVLFSTVYVSMTSSGRVFLFGSEYQPELDVKTRPSLDAQTARVYAAAGLSLAPGVIDQVTGGDLYVLPRFSESGVSQHLVYEFTIPQDEFHVWHTFVDAHIGTVLWRTNIVHDGVNGTVSSSVRTTSINQPPVTVPVTDQYVTIGGVNTTSDSLGNVTSNNSGSLTTKFEGPYCKISRQDGTNSQISTTVTNNTTFNLAWTATNSTASERTAFYAVNRSRRYILEMDPAISSLNYQVLTKVNLAQTCNANFDGSGLNFYRSGTSTQGTCPNAAEMVDVVMHEYGHLVNEKVYVQMGAGSAGMVNGAVHEGIADANAALQLDRPEMGVGFFGSNTVLRNLNNTNRYPRDIINEVHYDGLVIGGAVWDMRQAIGLTLASQYVHYARRGKPDDTNTGKAFTKYFLEVLKADDNDGNLANGTPNASSIVPAWAKHGIPSGMLTITHTKISGASGSTDIPVTASVTSALSQISTSTVTVWYRQHGTSTWSSAGLSKTSGNSNGTSVWAGSIPGQPDGSVIEYYLEAEESWGSEITSPSAGAAAPYQILVGFTRVSYYNFENANGWQGHISGDQAMTGKWIMADPVGTVYNSTQVQPEDDNSATGTKCWVTGNGTIGGDLGEQDVDDGETTLLSPTLDLTNLNVPVIRYYRWFSNNMGANPGGDPWVVEISSDNGATWARVENTTTSFNVWSENVIIVGDYITPTNAVRVRFVARDDDPQSLVEAAVDDFEILHAVNIPVEFLSVSATRRDGAVHVAWRTASELRNSGFDVEALQENGTVWQREGFVPGRGTSHTEAAYTYSFDETHGAVAFVRLRQIDFDGTESYSPAVAVAGAPASFTLLGVTPQPARESGLLQFDLPEAREVTLVLRNVLGEEIFTQERGVLVSGRHVARLDLSNLPAGVYMCTLTAGDQRAVTRFVHTR
ncbi:MAG: T9SS type A sorting domain-containing protein [Ignavibacteriae bacterium]|nr:T9SS type A sorting domain-containing protein [Ignavibacteriota bacterium]